MRSTSRLLAVEIEWSASGDYPPPVGAAGRLRGYLLIDGEHVYSERTALHIISHPYHFTTGSSFLIADLQTPSSFSAPWGLQSYQNDITTKGTTATQSLDFSWTTAAAS